MTTVHLASENLNVCILSTHFYPLHSGGGTQALQVSKRISRLDSRIKFTVLTQRYNDTLTLEKVDRIQIRRLGSPWLASLSPRLAYYYFLFKVAWFLLRFGQGFSILHCLSGYGISSVAILFGALYRRPVIVKIAAGELRSPGGRVKRCIYRLRVRILRYARTIVCLNNECQDVLSKDGVALERITHIPNGVDTARFVPPTSELDRIKLRQRLGFETKGKYAIFVGNIHPEKGITTLLQAWRLAVVEHPNSYLLIVGGLPKPEARVDIEFIKSFQSFIREKGEELHIRWLGIRQDVPDLLRLSDLFVFPSEREGMPNALLEAMAAGCPVLATKIPAVEQIVQEGVHGFLVPVNDVNALHAGLAKILGLDVALQSVYSKNVRSEILKRYDLDVVANNYLHLYYALISE